MARIRSIHPDALKSEKLAQCSAEGERMYWRLLTHCDDEGRAEDQPKVLAAYLFPLVEEVTGATLNGWLDELAILGLLVRYEVDGHRYLQVTKWKSYQRPQKSFKSTIPPLPDGYVTPTVHVPDKDGSDDIPVEEEVAPVVVVGVGDVAGDGEGVCASEYVESDSTSDPDTTSPSATNTDPVFEAFWESWPKRSGKRLCKAQAVKCWRTLTASEKVQALTGAQHYAAASDAGSQGAMDAFRWLQKRLWVDWQEPAEINGRPRRNGSNGDVYEHLYHGYREEEAHAAQ